MVDVSYEKSDEWYSLKGARYDRKNYTFYGTKVLNLKTQEIGLLICTWENKFSDAEIDFATCVDRKGKKYNI